MCTTDGIYFSVVNDLMNIEPLKSVVCVLKEQSLYLRLTENVVLSEKGFRTSCSTVNESYYKPV